VTRRRVIFAVVLALLVVLATGAALFLHRLLYTPEGLDVALRQLDRLQTIKVQVTGAKGVLAGALSADRVVVDHEAVHIEARGLRAQPRVRGLFAGLLTLEDVAIAKIDVTLKHREEQPESQPHFLPAWLRLAIPEFQANDIGLTLASGSRFHVRHIDGTVRITRWRLDVEPFTIDDPRGRLKGEVFLRAMQPLGLRGKADGHWQLPDRRTYRFAAAVRGNLDRLGADLALEQPARLSFAGTLLDLTERFRVVGAVRAIDFDGAPWIPAGRLPALNGSVAVVASATSIGVDGTLTSPALEAGPLRVQGAGDWHDQQLDVASFRAWLPRSALAVTTMGTLSFRGGMPQLALTGDWTALRWPLTGEPVVESLQGAYSLDGAMPYSFSTKADLRGPSIPTAAFDASGSFDQERLLLDRVEGTALKGRLAGSGRLAWTGDQAWQFAIVGKGLDISELRPEVQGRINVAGSIEGKGLTATAPWTARVSSLSGTLFNRALTGRGEISHHDGTFDLRQVRVSNGASHVELSGRYGAVMDLRWSADLRSLAIVAPGLAGELVSTGSARGTAAQPQVTGEARIRNLRYGDMSMDTADATLDVDTSDQRASHVDLRAGGVVAGGLRFDTVTMRASGLTREHGLDLELLSPGSPDRRITEFRGVLAASGSYDSVAHAWRGNLTEATIVFPDGQAKLLQPAAMEFGPDLLRSAPLCISTGESRLCVEGERRSQPGSWRVIYSAQDWPLKRILRTLLGWHEFDGQLQASGWAEKSPGHDWVGGTTMILDHPTLDIPRNKFRTERIDMGGGRVDVYAEPDSLRANLDLNLGENTRIHGEAFADRRPGTDLLASPLHGNLQGESAVLTALPLLVPEIDRSAGTLDAQVKIGGTLGEPEFNGDFHVRDGRFELYRTNLVLSKVDLDGRFIGDELTFDGRGEAAKGRITLDGRFTWPEGVMTGAMHLKGDRLLVADTPEYRVIASPNLTLRAGTEGYDIEGEIVVPTAKISPKDLTTSVSTSADERVIGLEVEDTGPATVQRIRSRIHVVLGDAVRVESYGLKARLDGEVTVLTKPDDVARGLGAINVVEGQYKAFGQDVKITKGKLSYNNTPLGEPLLELTAEREIKDEDVTVVVNVRGSLAKPFITITSTPAMSNNEALSYLLTGRSIDNLQSGEATSVNKAAENLAVSGGGFLLGGVGTKLGLDEVTVERTDTEDTSVTLGKFLSPKLFVSYGVSIAEAINTIKLRYTLNERWSVKAEAGLEQSADFEYKIER
jgi:translocation and assembly module TamB